MRIRTIHTIALALALAASAIAVAGCGGSSSSSSSSSSTGETGSSSGLPQGSEPVNLDPADFTTQIDNPYFPMTPGSRWVYHEEENGQSMQVVVEVTDTTKVIDGVTTRAVHDLVSENGQPVEDTIDYYAQDAVGNIWYFGENTKEYENGKVSSTAGSFLAGVDGAEAGVAVPGSPEVGMFYRQEYYAGQAEDAGRVLSVSEQAETPAGHFGNALMTEDTNPLEPKHLEFKLYAKGVGPAIELLVSGGSGRAELLSFTPGK